MTEILLDINKVLPKKVLDILLLAGSIGDSMCIKVFCVGGFVRDALLHYHNLDIDIVVEGNGMEFAKELSSLLKGTLVLYRRFGTATVATRDNFKIDIATARIEHYEFPGALPMVSFSSIKDDLQRRDFTINAMSFSLNKVPWSRLLDPFNGKRDLEKGIIRVLHNKSFIDDPTRIYRAVRFEQRYDFVICDETERLIKEAIELGALNKVSEYRIKKEKALVQAEKNPSKVFDRLEQFIGERDVS